MIIILSYDDHQNVHDTNPLTDQETLMMGGSGHMRGGEEEEMKVPTRKEQESLLRR